MSRRQCCGLYGWSVPTLSLGYFQRLAEVRADARWRDVPIGAAADGRGAIWHHHEVTYALAVPESHPLARPSTQLYRAVHAAISGGLVGLGIGAVRRGEVFPPEDCERSRPLLCFTDRSPEDIVFEGIKIVGSAQRRAGGPSSNMDPFCWHDRLGRPSYPVSAMSRISRPIRGSGQTGWWSGSRRALSCIATAADSSGRDSRAGERARSRPVPRAGLDGNSVSRSLRVRVTLFNLRKIKLQ